MIGDRSLAAKTSARFAAPPWNQHSERWLELDDQLPPFTTVIDALCPQIAALVPKAR